MASGTRSVTSLPSSCSKTSRTSPSKSWLWSRRSCQTTSKSFTSAKRNRDLPLVSGPELAAYKVSETNERACDLRVAWRSATPAIEPAVRFESMSDEFPGQVARRSNAQHVDIRDELGFALVSAAIEDWNLGDGIPALSSEMAIEQVLLSSILVHAYAKGACVGAFPGPEHVFHLAPEELEEFETMRQ